MYIGLFVWWPNLINAIYFFEYILLLYGALSIFLNEKKIK